MKYRIKNPEIEKAVRYLYKANFPFNGLTAYEHIPESKMVRFYVDEKSSVSNCNLIFELHESLIEEANEYDPKEWNQWPKVRPIKVGNYRVEHDENGYTYKFGFYWNGHFWEGRKGYGPLCSNTFQNGFRFKPWYDEWEDKE